jgi:hypothetical protein
LALLVATVFGAIIFSFLNIQRGALPLAVVELGMGVFATWLIFVVRRTHRLRLWTLIYLIPFFGAMVFAMSTPLASPTVFIWIFLTPIIAHLLLGRWLGLAVASFFLIAAGAVFLARFMDEAQLVDTIAIANVIVFSLVLMALSHVAEYTRERSDRLLLERASSDALTGLANRTHLKTVFQRERQRALRQATPLSLVILDLDDFKQVNDRYGHETGDAALVHAAGILRQRLRATDLACRHGGEEFAAEHQLDRENRHDGRDDESRHGRVDRVEGLDLVVGVEPRCGRGEQLVERDERNPRDRDEHEDDVEGEHPDDGKQERENNPDPTRDPRRTRIRTGSR